jgi:hypothetical protein
MWDAIAFHATPSFALHKEPEVLLAHIGIMADFWGPGFPNYSITIEENKEIVDAFPRLRFKEQFLEIMCGLCAVYVRSMCLETGNYLRQFRGQIWR